MLIDELYDLILSEVLRLSIFIVEYDAVSLFGFFDG